MGTSHNFVHTAEVLGKNVHVGNIFSGDLFYDPRKETFDLMKKMGILAVEMEAAGLYGVASDMGLKLSQLQLFQMSFQKIYKCLLKKRDRIKNNG